MTTTTKTINRITNDDTARAWMTDNGFASRLDLVTTHATLGQVVVESAQCWKCGGSGYGNWLPDGGRCYTCGGADTRNHTKTTRLKSYAQRLKREHTARAKRQAEAQAREAAKLDRQRDWSEKNGHGRLTFDELNEKRRAEREANAEHVGTVGQRDTFDLTLLFTREFDGAYGTRVLHVFADQDDNRVTWWGGRYLDVAGFEAEKRDRVIVKATVKAHDDYQGVPQTTITRPKVVEAVVMSLTDRGVNAR